MLERDLETKVRKHAIAAGWYTRKFTSPAQRGVPDRIFIKAGRVVFIEFKAPGKRARVTDLQARELAALQAAGVEAYVCDSVEQSAAVLGF